VSVVAIAPDVESSTEAAQALPLTAPGRRSSNVLDLPACICASLHIDQVGSWDVADEPQDLVLEHLRRVDGKVDGLLAEFRYFNLRIGSMEDRTVGLHLIHAQQTSEIDRIKNRLDRIERRLELVDR